MNESSDELNKALADLIGFAQRSEELRTLLVRLGRAFVGLDGPAAEQPVAPKLSDAPAQIPAETPPIVVPPTAQVELRSMLEPIIAPVLLSKPAISPLVDEDLPQAAAKFDVKADGCDWHVKRRQLLDRGADFQFDIAPQDKLIMDRARMAGGSWMWMCRPESPTPELPLMQVAAECYRNSARATRLVVQTRGKYSPASQEYTAALNLLAESLSALRVAITDIDEYVDPDQNAVFLWLRSETFSSSVFVERHMRLDDPANPQDCVVTQ